MDTLFRYAVGAIQLKIIHLLNSPLVEQSELTQSELTLEEVVDYIGYHLIRLQEVYSGRRRCNMCNRRCAIATGCYGQCHSVANIGTGLISTNYGLITGIGTTNVDFDLLYFKPDATVLYVAGLGCNFRCSTCLNACITHARLMHPQLLSALVQCQLEPDDVVETAKKEKVSGIVFGGNEPTVNLDFVLDTASLAKQAGLFVAFQTNGYITPEAIELLASNVDAVVVGLKAFGDVDVYKWLFERKLNYEQILESIKAFHERGVHVEVTSLVVKSDNMEASARQTSKWLATNVNHEIPLYIYRMLPFYSSYWQKSYELSTRKVNRIVSICRDAGLVNVYNRDDSHDVPTYCTNCGKIVIQRTTRDNALSCNTTGVVSFNRPQYDVRYVGLNVVEGKGYCANCGNAIYGIWK